MNKMNLMVFRMIKNSKGQFFAVLIIIISGICIYTSMSMVSDNLSKTVDTYYQSTHFPHLFIEAQGVPATEVNRLKEIDGVKETSASLTMDVPALVDNENHKTLRLVTIEEDLDKGLSRSTILEGRPLSSTNKEALLIGQYAKANDIVPGDEVLVQVFGINHKLKVVGIVANPEYIYMVENVQSIMPDDISFGVCYISESTGRMLMEESQNFNYLRVEYELFADEQAIITQIEKKLKPYGIQSVLERKNQLSNAIVQEELASIGLISNFIPILFLIAASFILIMILSRIVKNDRLKIGVLKAVGYSNKQILAHYMKYAIIAGLISGFLGAITGMALANAMTKLFLEFFHIPLLEFQLDLSYLFKAVLLTVAFCIISGFLGAKGILEINPADAMQEEAPKIGKPILLEKITFLWKRFSFSRKLVMKSIFRNKKRTVFVVSGIAVTYALIMFATAMPEVVDQMMNQHFTEFQKMDYDIGFHKPTKENVIKDLKHIVEVEHVEGKIDFPFELSRGNKKQSVNIIGLDRNTSFYSFTSQDGKTVPLNSNGILLSENLARALKVNIGDSIEVKNYLTDKDEVLIPVSAIVKQTLGMNAYMDIKEMQNTLLESSMITGLLLNSHDEEISSKLLEATNIATVMSTNDVKSVYEEYMGMIFTSIAFMLVFSGIIGFSIVYIATIVSINEREGEFSSLRVLGFTKSEIFKMIRSENIFITIAGIIIGIPLGQLFCKYSSLAFTTDIYTLDIAPTLSTGIISGVFTIIFIVFAQLATYRKIHKLDFLQALKNRVG